MSLTGTVEHDMVRLPQGFHLPDGTRVQIVLVQDTQPELPVSDPIIRHGKDPVDDLLTEGARDHDVHSVLDIPAVHLGEFRQLGSPEQDGDRLGEMLEGRM